MGSKLSYFGGIYKIKFTENEEWLSKHEWVYKNYGKLMTCGCKGREGQKIVGF